mgnify:CR=1 FL=1
MKILLNNNDLNEALNEVSNLGFVPTMGSLHKGHISLIKKSLKECKNTIVSIFINPTQFNSKKDYKNYPRNNQKDLSILKKLKINFLYLPNKNDVYNSRRKRKIKISKKNQIMCAKFRKGHFEGVIDVMDRLSALIKPKKIYMGKKDLQQLYLVKDYIKKKYKSKIISCKTVRDKTGLALSSRNSLLNRKNLSKARKLTKNLFFFKKRLRGKKNIRDLINQKKVELTRLYGVKIEYLEFRNIKTLKITTKFNNSNIFIAYYLNKIRLIDNL